MATSGDSSARVEWPPEWIAGELFDRITRRALERADELHPKLGDLLRLLADCRPNGWSQETRGATYKQIAYIAHLAGLEEGAERWYWRRVCRQLGLTQRHAGHIIARLDDRERERSAS